MGRAGAVALEVGRDVEGGVHPAVVLQDLLRDPALGLKKGGILNYSYNKCDLKIAIVNKGSSIPGICYSYSIFTCGPISQYRALFCPHMLLYEYVAR